MKYVQTPKHAPINMSNGTPIRKSRFQSTHVLKRRMTGSPLCKARDYLCRRFARTFGERDRNKAEPCIGFSYTTDGICLWRTGQRHVCLLAPVLWNETGNWSYYTMSVILMSVHRLNTYANYFGVDRRTAHILQRDRKPSLIYHWTSISNLLRRQWKSGGRISGNTHSSCWTHIIGDLLTRKVGITAARGKFRDDWY